jgi:cyanophycinase-like exopeptidase
MSSRLLMIAGSGETSPRMAPVHRAIVDRLAEGLRREVRAVMLDTPYGFQENVDDVTARTVRYFRDRVGLRVEPIGFRRSGSANEEAAATEAVRAADFVFAGPGSPTYALAHWRNSGVAWALREKLESGGALSFASAAAITMGSVAMPVYEIYKAGHEPRWLPGLDLLSVAGWRVAVVPHFDNREGRAHDTRFCYLGERRFAALERELAGDTWVLGIDEDTALVVDLDEQTAEVHGPGAATVRARGTVREMRSGSAFPIRDLVPVPLSLGSEGTAAVGPGRREADPLDARARAALEASDVSTSLAATLDLERLAGGSDEESDRARVALRSAILGLAELAGRGRAERRRAEALVSALVSARERARAAGDWMTADTIRDALGGAGVSVQDTQAGTVLQREAPSSDEATRATSRAARSGAGRR